MTNTPNLAPAIAAVMGGAKPYDSRAIAAQVITLEHFDAPAQFYTVGDYQGCFVNMSFREGSWARSYLTAMKDRHDTARHQAERLIAQGGPADIVAPIFDAWAGRHAAASIAAIRSFQGQASAMVTGPSNFPVRRQEKLRNASDRRDQRLADMVPAVIKRMKRAAFPHGAPGEAIRSSNPDAAELLGDKIAKLQAELDAKKALNAAWRKAGKPGIGDEAGWTRFAELAQGLGWKPCSVAIIRKSCEGHYMARSRPMPPAEGYELTSLNARIKTARGRIAEIEAMPAATDEDAASAIDTPAGKVERIENGDAARIQLMFEGKPAPKIRAILKSNGFRWAPSQGAWQRHLNTNGRAAADRALAQIKEA